jgi:hypothetical protein
MGTLTPTMLDQLDADLRQTLDILGGGPENQHTIVTVQILRNLSALEQKMSQELDNLNSAVAAVQQQTAALISRVDAISQQLNTALANNDSAAVQAAADALNKVVSDEQAALARDTLPAGGGTGTATGTATATPTPSPSDKPHMM